MNRSRIAAAAVLTSAAVATTLFTGAGSASAASFLGGQCYQNQALNSGLRLQVLSLATATSGPTVSLDAFYYREINVGGTYVRNSQNESIPTASLTTLTKNSICAAVSRDYPFGAGFFN